MNKRTINEIYKLRNNKKNIKKLGTKIKDLGQRFRVKRHSIRNGNKNRNIKQVTIRNKMKELRIRNKN